MSDEDWADAAAKQEREAKERLAEKISQMRLRQQQEQRAGSDGWPQLPADSKPKAIGRGFKSDSSNPRPPADGWPQLEEDTAPKRDGGFGNFGNSESSQDGGGNNSWSQMPDESKSKSSGRGFKLDSSTSRHPGDGWSQLSTDAVPKREGFGLVNSGSSNHQVGSNGWPQMPTDMKTKTFGGGFTSESSKPRPSGDGWPDLPPDTTSNSQSSKYRDGSNGWSQSSADSKPKSFGGGSNFEPSKPRPQANNWSGTPDDSSKREGFGGMKYESSKQQGGYNNDRPEYTKPGSSEWPEYKGGNAGSNDWSEYSNDKPKGNDWSEYSTGKPGSGHGSAGGGSSTVGRLPEENWDDDVEKPLDQAEISYLNKILHDKLLNTKYNVEIERQHPNNPLFSVKSFEELRLSKELLKSIYEMGFSYPSKIQEFALPTLLADPPQNMIAQSQSGTGKTAAFVLTMLSRVDPNLQYPQCLCLSPTYELSLQTGKIVEQMGKYLSDVKIAYAVRGGLRVERGMQVTQQIIIGTPGTVLDWILKFRCFDPKKITVFVMDEADLMIGLQGHQDQSIRIHKTLSPECQHLLFSATYDDQVMEFANKIINDPVKITLQREDQTLDYIKQYYVMCRTRDDKYRALCNIYGTLTIGQAVIFCYTKKEASWLAGQMSKDGHSVALLSGELDIDQRAAVIDRFKKGQEKVLISTNLTARGIDVEQVTIVINYDMPLTVDKQPDFDTYLHRIGRTGRFGKAGIAINFIDSNWSKNILQQIESHFGKKILPLNTEDVDALAGIEADQ